MKLAARKANIQKSEDFEQNNFKINASAQAFKILSDGLYSNKIKAVIREISCNAADAHTAAGNKKPFVVTLPNTMNPDFRVRDYGTGLCHDDVMKLYTTYFLSDKNHTNAVTGGFGLGSKSPFAYTDNFDVVSYFNGEKRTYCAIIGATGAPEINLMSVENTDESNGLEVSFPVQRHDISRFTEEASNVFRAFKDKPQIEGYVESNWVSGGTLDMEDKGGEVFLESDDWVLKQRGYYYDNNSVIRMGNVDYPFPEELSNCDESSLFQSADLILTVPVGFVDPTPARENLSMNPTSTAALKGKLKEITKEINVLVQKEVKSCTSIWEARLIFRKFTGNGSPIANAAKNLIDWKWKGQEVQNNINLSKLYSDKRSEIEIIEYSKSAKYVKGDYKDVVSATSVDGVFHPKESHVFLLDDYDKRADYKVRNYIREYGDNSKTYVLVTTAKKTRLKEFLRVLGISLKDMESVTGLPLPTKKARTYTPSTRGPKVDGDAPAFLYKGNTGYPEDSWEPKSVNVNTETGYYIEIRRWKPVYTKAGTDYPTELEQRATSCIRDCLKALGVDVGDIHGVKTAKLAKFKDSDKWENLVDVAKAKIDELNNDVDINSSRTVGEEYNNGQKFLPKGSYYNKERSLGQLCDFFKRNESEFDSEGVFAKKMEGVNTFVKDKDIKLKREALDSLQGATRYIPKVDKDLKCRNVYDEAAEAIAAYPLLEVVVQDNLNRLGHKEYSSKIIEYIKLIDSTTK